MPASQPAAAAAPALPGAPQTGGRLDRETTTRREAERLERIAKAERAQLEVARLRRELLPADRVFRTVEVFARVWRDSLLALPTSAGEEVAAELGVESQLVITALERIIRQFLEDMSKHVFKMADEADGGDGGER